MEGKAATNAVVAFYAVPPDVMDKIVRNLAAQQWAAAAPLMSLLQSRVRAVSQEDAKGLKMSPWEAE
jgi:hypothetical protein